MRKVLIFFLVSLSLLPVSSSGKKEILELPERNGTTFTIVYPESRDTLLLDPFSASDEISLMVLEGLYEGLFRFDEETGNPVPAYAESYTISEDGLTYTIRLKEGSMFSNGEAITARTFIDSWFLLLEASGPGTQKSSLISLFDVVRGARNYRLSGTSKGDVGLSSPSSSELVIQLHNRAPYLISLLATVPFSAVYPAETGYGGGIITSGAFTLETVSDTEILLKKNLSYRDQAEVKSDYISFKAMNEEESSAAYRNREADWFTVYIPIQELRSPLDLHIDPIYSTGFFYFSRNDGTYSDPLIRKALSLITPWDALRGASGQPFPTSSFLPFSRHGGTEEEGTVEEARQLIREAGYSTAGELPPLTIAIHRGSALAEIAETLADLYSEKLGITVIVDTVPLSLYTRYPSANPYDLSYITWVADFHDPVAFLNLFYGKSAYNIGNYHNEEYDSLFESALFSTSETERAFFMEESHKFLLNDSLLFPLYTGFSLNTVDNERVKGWHANDLNIHPLRSLEIIE